jgi:hypothetical protein
VARLPQVRPSANAMASTDFSAGNAASAARRSACGPGTSTPPLAARLEVDGWNLVGGAVLVAAAVRIFALPPSTASGFSREVSVAVPTIPLALTLVSMRFDLRRGPLLPLMAPLVGV